VPEDWPATLLMLSALLLLGLGTGLARQRGQGWAWMIGLAWFGFGSFGPALGGQVVKMATAPRYAIQGAPPLLLLLAASLV